MVITSRSTINSVFFLILDFISVGCLFIMVGAEFLGMILLIVYVGAVAVLFLFVVMMLNVAEQKQSWFIGKKSTQYSYWINCKCIDFIRVISSCRRVEIQRGCNVQQHTVFIRYIKYSSIRFSYVHRLYFIFSIGRNSTFVGYDWSHSFNIQRKIRSKKTELQTNFKKPLNSSRTNRSKI